MKAQELIALVDKEHDSMLQLWQELVNVDCGPGCKEGVDGIADKLQAVLEGMGFAARQVPFTEAGNMLVAEYGDMTKPFIVLTGHMDTVFKKGTVAERQFQIEGDKVYGPGCLDMKGGIVIMLTALKLLLSQGYAKHPIKVILAGDEEVGHANSTAPDYIMTESKGAFAAFNFETGFLDNGLVTERKGMYQFMLEVFGRGAHVGNDPENGRSAIKEIAHKLLDIEALTDWESGTTFNVGVIEGGTVCNAAPAYAKILCDMRYVDYSNIPAMKEKLAEIAAKQYVPDTKTVLTTITEFREMHVLPGTMKLLNLVQEAAGECGLAIPQAKAVGGASDSAYTTAAGVPTICAMGVQGARNHTAEEYAVLPTLYSRCKLFINVLLKI